MAACQATWREKQQYHNAFNVFTSSLGFLWAIRRVCFNKHLGTLLTDRELLLRQRRTNPVYYG